MGIVASLATTLLLVPLLLPFVAALVLASFFRSSVSRLRIGATIFLLLITASLILGILTFTSVEGRSPTGLVVAWSLPVPAGPTILNEISCRWDRFNAGLLMLLPWGAMTASLFSGSLDTRARRLPLSLAMLGSVNWFLTGGEIPTALTGGFLAAVFFGFLLQDSGNQESRLFGRRYQTAQWIGLLLLTGGLGMLIGISSLVQSAPRGQPGPTTAAFIELGNVITLTQSSHEAAGEFWKDSRGLPLLTILLAILLVSGLFPLHIWLSQALSSGTLFGCVWLILWSQSVLYAGARWLTQLDAQTLADLQSGGLFISILGTLYCSCLAYGEARPGKFLAATVGWCLSISLLAICSAMLHVERFAVPWSLCLSSGLVLLTIAMSPALADEQRRQLPHRLAMRMALITLTLTPTVIGSFQLWLGLASLQNWGQLGTFRAWGVILVSNLFMLSGLLRMSRLLTAMVPDPVEPVNGTPVLDQFGRACGREERLSLNETSGFLATPPTFGQKLLIGCWIGLATLTGFLLPLANRFVL